MGKIKATIPIGIQPGTKLIHMTWEVDESGNFWKLWIHHSPMFEDGTFLELHVDGSIQRVTVGRDGSEQRFRVK